MCGIVWRGDVGISVVLDNTLGLNWWMIERLTWNGKRLTRRVCRASVRVACNGHL